MTKPIKIHTGNCIKIVRRRCLPMIQPKVKVGNLYFVTGGGDGYITIDASNKQGFTKLSFKNYDFEIVPIKKMQQKISQMKNNIVHNFCEEHLTTEEMLQCYTYTFICEVMAMDWSNRARMEAARFQMPMRKQSRRLREMYDEYDKWMRQTRGKTADKALNEREMAREWREKFKSTDHELLQLCKKETKNMFPGANVEVCARAMATLVWSCVYQLQWLDALQVLEKKIPLQVFKPLPLMEELHTIMVSYFPEKRLVHSVQLDAMIDRIHKQLNSFTVDDLMKIL